MLRIYNSLTKNKEIFQPLEPGVAKLYVCGPTVYDEPHIGHLRSAYAFEVIRRVLVFSGLRVRFVRNVTDVDDKIIDKARQSASADLVSETRSVSDRYHRRYQEDLAALGIEPPNEEPKATAHIADMLRLTETLLAKGFAYESGGDVYFDVNRFAAYGKLSHQNKEAILQNVRIEKNDKKKDPLDFALWKGAKEGEPNWPSPWGPGRPGWHIECSAMSMKYLGETFDIHGGGRDLIFPHHENEIAQSEAATGRSFANVWVHHGLVTINGQKMAKSLKNFITLADIRKQYGETGIEELKFLFLGTHYSMPLDFSDERMKMERSVRQRFLNYLIEGSNFKGYEVKPAPELEVYDRRFQEAMEDDFNTSLALTVLHEMVDFAWKSEKVSIRLAVKEKLMQFGKILGLSFEDSVTSSSAPLEVERLIREREEAKRNKDFAAADSIRQEILKTYGLELIDQKDGGTHWKRKN